MPRSHFRWPLAVLMALPLAAQATPRQVSGIYPHLAMWNEEGECGTGAVVPWAGRLWVATYAPHRPQGSTDKLYTISQDLVQAVRPESVGGTVANRFVHLESNQLFLGPHAIAADGTVRTIPYSTMFGRHTGVARHLTDPAHKVVFATMEEGVYEVDVATLAVTELWADEQRPGGRHAGLPGYHGKGFASGQGHYVYANNGDHALAARTDPAVASGVLAEWDGVGEAWTVVRRNQFTDVTGPGGIAGSAPDAPLWSIGWDHRSLLLMLRDSGRWHSFRLPKCSHAYDGAHGWNTEWPRIRDVGEDALLMTMHGAFWSFPRTFAAGRTAGLAPRSNYLKVVGDFCSWNGQVVLGCDDTAKSEFLNRHPLKGELVGPGQSHSNLVFLAPAQLDGFGPVLARGALWQDEDVQAGVPSEPFLLTNLAHRSLFVAHRTAGPATTTPIVTLEVDERGDGRWRQARRLVLAAATTWIDLSAVAGVWFRLTSDHDLVGALAVFHGREHDHRTLAASPIFAGLGGGATTRGVLHVRGGGHRTLRCVHDGTAYDLDGELRLSRRDDPEGALWTAKHAAIPASRLGRDLASGYWLDANGTRWRLPLSPTTPHDGTGRVCREVVTERNLLHAFGTLYELPADNAGGFRKLRPISSHDRAIDDYASYRGLLVMSGVDREAAASEHIVRSDDGKLALWVGAIDDLWQLGKPRGVGGPWRDSKVAKGQPSDPYLCTGFDQKRLVVTTDVAARIRIEADFTGTGDWREFTTLIVAAEQQHHFEFPPAFGAYWLRLVSDVDTTATAQFTWQ